jgi:hypothetical protein
MMQTIEDRVLAAIRREGRPLTVWELRGPGMPGLSSLKASELRAACEALAAAGQLLRVRSYTRKGKPAIEYVRRSEGSVP